MAESELTKARFGFGAAKIMMSAAEGMVNELPATKEDLMDILDKIIAELAKVKENANKT